MSADTGSGGEDGGEISETHYGLDVLATLSQKEKYVCLV